MTYVKAMTQLRGEYEGHLLRMTLRVRVAAPGMTEPEIAAFLMGAAYTAVTISRSALVCTEDAVRELERRGKG